MNILLFVMSMLLVLTLMTYARLDTFRGMTGVEAEFTRYMQTIERTYINMSADKMYNRIKFKSATASQQQESNQSTNKAPGSQQEPNKETETSPRKGKSTGRLSISLLLYPQEREGKEKEYMETAALFKKLVQLLYGQQKQFQELLQKRPTIVEELLDTLPRAVEALPQDKKLKRAADLANLDLGGELDEPFYMMLKGCPGIVKPPSLKTISENGDENPDDTEEAEEYKSDKSASSLLNFIDLRKNSKINIYLASKPLLITIYGDSHLADQILQTRYSLYRAVENKEMSQADATEKLKAEFQLGGEDSLLEYKVTGSNPQGYN